MPNHLWCRAAILSEILTTIQKLSEFRLACQNYFSEILTIPIVRNFFSEFWQFLIYKLKIWAWEKNFPNSSAITFRHFNRCEGPNKDYFGRFFDVLAKIRHLCHFSTHCQNFGSIVRIFTGHCQNFVRTIWQPCLKGCFRCCFRCGTAPRAGLRK